MNKNEFSNYFIIMSRILSNNLEENIVKKQLIFIQTTKNQFSRLHKLSLEVILNLLNFQEDCQNLFLKIISLKIDFWNFYVEGNIKQFDVTISFIYLIKQATQQKLRLEIFRLKKLLDNYQIREQSLIYYRIQQLYHMIVTKDEKAIKKYEHQYIDMIRKDRQMPEEYLTSLKLVENDVVILIASILQDKGKIINKKTPRLAQFFQFNFESFKHIENIKQLMPSFIARVHDQLIENYLRRSYSTIIKANDRNVFMKTEDGFIQPVCLNLENIFEMNNEFALIGSLMQNRQNKDYLIFDQSGKIQGISERLFDSIKEKYEFLQRKQKNFFQQEEDHKFMKNEFMENAYIFMLFPQLIHVIKTFLLKHQAALMKQNIHAELSEEKLKKYLIQNLGQKFDICSNYKTELYVSVDLLTLLSAFRDYFRIQNVHKFQEQHTLQRKNSLLVSFRTLRQEKEAQQYEQEYQRMIKKSENKIRGLSLFDFSSLDLIQNYMDQHRIGYIFQGGFFKYYIRINLQAVMLEYNKHMLPFFILQVNERKVTKQVLKRLFTTRKEDEQINISKRMVNKKKTNRTNASQKTWFKSMIEQYEDSDEVEMPKKYQSGEKKKSFWSTVSLKLSRNQKNPMKKSGRLHQGEDSDSANQFDEDITENSSDFQTNNGQVNIDVARRGSIKQDDQQSQSSTSSRTEGGKMGTQMIQMILSKETLTRGENQLVIINILFLCIVLITQILLIINLNQSKTQYSRLMQQFSELPEIKTNYEKILTGHYLNELNYQNAQKYILDGELDYVKALQGYLKVIIDLNNLDTVNLRLEGESIRISPISFFQSVTQYFGDQQYLKDNLLVSNKQVLNNLEISQQILKDQIDNQALLMILILTCYFLFNVGFLISAFLANRKYYHYLKFVIQSITRIKYEECFIEIKRLKSYQDILKDEVHPWIAKDLFSIYFDEQVNVSLPQNIRKQREKMSDMNSSFNAKFDGQVSYFLYFFIIAFIFILYFGGQAYYNYHFLDQQQNLLNLQTDFENLHQHISTYITLWSITQVDQNEALVQLRQNKIIEIKDLFNIFLQKSSINEYYESIFEEYFRNDLCPYTRDACETSYKKVHLQKGLTQMITGLQNEGSQRDQELFIMDFYEYMNDYYMYVDEQLEVFIVNSIDTKWFLLFYINGSIVYLIVIVIMNLLKRKMTNERKGFQILLCLIPHEKLILESTVNLMKQLHKL